MKYKIIVTGIGILLLIICVVLFKAFLKQKGDLQEARCDQQTLVVANTIFKDALGRMHAEVYNANINVEILKNSNDSLQRALYREYKRNKDKKKVTTVGGLTFSTSNEIKAPIVQEGELKCADIDDGFLSGMFCIYPDSVSFGYSYADTAFYSKKVVKDKWTLKYILPKYWGTRITHVSVDFFFSNPNTRILDLKEYNVR